jgi:hypothetical protein
VTRPADGNDADPVAALTGGQLAALERRLADANTPGNLDGLVAYHALGKAEVGFVWNIDPIGGSWLESHLHRLNEAPTLAALGFGLTHYPMTTSDALVSEVRDGLRRVMQRDVFQGDRVSFLYDARQLLGICLAALHVRPEIPQFEQWLRDTLLDPRRRPTDRFHDLLARHSLAMFDGRVVNVTDAAAMTDVSELALVHWMISEGTAQLVDPDLEVRQLERHVMDGALRSDARELTVPAAALVLRAAGDILSFSVEQLVLSRAHVGQVLRRFQASMRRWRWDTDQVQHPVCWEIGSEREVQDILWLVLRSVFDDVVDEETLPKIGHSSYRADFGLPRLGVLIEVKFARKAEDFKKFEQEVMVDSIGYLAKTDRYREIVVFIYDDSSSVEQHDLTSRTLMDLQGISDVIIVSRPGVLPAALRTSGRRARNRPNAAQ